MLWINFLHFYQPPTTPDKTIDEVAKSSYQSWVDFLNKHKNVRVTVNFSGCITERLQMAGHYKLLKDLAKLAERGQIEFVSSAAFHPILPLIPKKEIIKQIEINNQINKKRFGKIYNPQGFYLPEMAYNKEVAEIIKSLGYKYIILDQIAFNGSLDEKIDNNIKYKIKGLNLYVVFRDREVSQTFVPETIINKLKENEFKNDQVLITATDGELYGHHYWNWWPSYSHLTQKHKNTKTQKHFFVQTLTISEYLNQLKEDKEIKPVESSWESSEDELREGLPYVIWKDSKNKIHKLLWKLSDLALKLNWDNEADSNYFASRLHLEKGLASCTFWWASGKDFKMFSPHAWQTSMVEVGAHELLNSVRSLEKINKKHKIKAEKIFSKIRSLLWHKHWKK